ncbi:MAG: phage/plasmid primase, P4 family [bacterium]
MNEKRPTVEFALKYAERGWPVFRLAPGTNIPMAGSHGHKDATTDEDLIRAWWANEPEANIGISAGPAGLVVFDVDPRNGGEESFHDLRERHGCAWITTWTVLSPSGGQHLYFTADPEMEIRGRTGVWPGIDVKAYGGYVAAPPSRRKQGVYEWEAGFDPELMPALPVPEWLLQELNGQPSVANRMATPVGSVIPVRQRNDTLTSIAGTMRHRGLGKEAIMAALLVVNREQCEEPLENREVERIAASVASYPAAYEGSAAPSLLKLTDLGNAERLVRDHADSLRYCRAHACWYHWDGRRWARDETGVVERSAKSTVRRIYQEAAGGASEEVRSAVARHAVRSESNRAIQAMLARAQVEDAFAIEPSAFDRDIWVLNCLNGTLDLRTGKLLPHCREQLITKLAPVEFDADARDERWEAFLNSACEGDVDLKGFLQLFFGYGLTGDTGEEKVAFLQGPGGTGKGTFIEAVRATMGDYAATADFETFLLKSSTGGPRPDIARLAGARLVIASEADEGRRFSTGVLKQLTGGDTVTARFLYGRDFEFVPQFKLALVANDAPKLKSSDSGAWRRLLRVPFTHCIPLHEQDKSVKEHVKTGARQAVFAWLVEGCLRWQRDGLKVPDAVSQSTSEYRESSDAVAEFFDDELDFGAGAKATSAELYGTYKRWAMRNGVTELYSQQDLAVSLEARGCTRTRGGAGVRCWRGVSIRCYQRPSSRVSDTGDRGDADSGKTSIVKIYGGSLAESASLASLASPRPSTRAQECRECGGFDWLVEVDGMRCERCGAFVEAAR